MDTAGGVILANAVVQAVQPHQESFPLPQPRVEVSGVPLPDEVPQTGWLTSLDAPPQSQVLADPLPTAQTQPLLFETTPSGRRIDPSHIDRIFNQREFTGEEVDDIIDNFDEVFVQSEGATVHLKNSSNGNDDVVITGSDDDNFIVTAIRNLTGQGLEAKIDGGHWSQ